jgi:hypothetical protein
MHRIIHLAERVRHAYHIDGLATEDRIDAAIGHMGLELVENLPLKGRLLGFHYDGVIGVREGLSGGERRAIKAHELGHYLLDNVNALYVVTSPQRLLLNRYEARAQMFAGALLLGPPDESAGLDERLHEAYEDGIPLGFLFSYVGAVVAIKDGDGLGLFERAHARTGC